MVHSLPLVHPVPSPVLVLDRLNELFQLVHTLWRQITCNGEPLCRVGLISHQAVHFGELEHDIRLFG